MATTMNLLQPYVGTRDVDRRFVRRRTAAAGILLALCVALGIALFQLEVRPGGIPASAAGSGPASASQPAVLPAGVADRFYIVEAGDSLWSIARAHAPHRDVRVYADELEELNGGTRIQPGQRLLLPG
ncbi:MAG: LysM peptidoglycan-binding domain-containing protein [Acidimicrobiia bacterium]